MGSTIYNMVGSDGSWFSPFGWRVRVMLLAKRVPVVWKDIRVSEMGDALAFADTRSTPLLVAHNETGQQLLKSTKSIATHVEQQFPSPPFFPDRLRGAIDVLDQLMDNTWQVPGFAAWAPTYFETGVIAGADAAIFRTIIQRATGRSVEQNQERQADLVAAFQRSLAPFERMVTNQDWLLEDLSYADALLFSCLKCFATVNRSLEPVVGSGRVALTAWYRRMHERCHIEDPDGPPGPEHLSGS